MACVCSRESSPLPPEVVCRILNRGFGDSKIWFLQKLNFLLQGDILLQDDCPRRSYFAKICLFFLENVESSQQLASETIFPEVLIGLVIKTYTFGLWFIQKVHRDIPCIRQVWKGLGIQTRAPRLEEWRGGEREMTSGIGLTGCILLTPTKSLADSKDKASAGDPWPVFVLSFFCFETQTLECFH